MHKMCLDSNVTAQLIRDFIRENENESEDEDGSASTIRTATTCTEHEEMSPLHIIAMNPYADPGAVMTCFDTNMDAAFVRDNEGKTPLEYLREYDKLSAHNLIVAALCTHWSMN